MERHYARTRCTFVLFLCLSCCVYAFPHVAYRNVKQGLPISNAQVHYNITDADITGSPPIDEISYVDFDPPFLSERPNVCNDCICGVGRTSRIVGGNVTTVYNFPWIVSMYKKGMFYCAGTIITRKHVLTAAHCLDGFEINVIKLVLADSDRPSIGKYTVVRHIKSVTMHENFHAYTYNNDIAIIEMDEPVPVGGANSVLRTACLPENKDIDYTGATAIVVGWGRTGETKPISNELRKVNLPILAPIECNQAGYAKNRITKNMFCAGYLRDAERRMDACFGDSGGPLHVKGSHGQLHVIGIISWGRGCARPNFPGVYTKLTNYIGWLKDHLNGECVCRPPHSE